jgi:predicted alpha-1,2-mannosidase
MYAEFQQPILASTMWNGDRMDARARVEQGRHAGVWLDFGDQRTVTMKVGLSYVNVRHAQANMQVEIPTWKFGWVRGAARATWSDLLKRVEVQGGTAEQRKIFYTGLYHMLLSPNLFSDYTGAYMGFDGQVHQAKLRGAPCSGFCAGAQYANFSDWDIYRDVIQMQALLDPAAVSDMAQSLVRDAEQSGWLPRWPAANDVTYVMGGDSPDILLADAWAYGARNFDVKTALHFMVKGATDPGRGPHGEAERPFLKDELKLGYVAVNHDSIAVSRSLEYASDDFAIAQLARAVGEEPLAAKFTKRAGNWRNLFDPETKWLRPRNSDGTWLLGFDADRSLPKRPNAPESSDQDGYEEGNAWQYSFMIPFDYARLMAKMGGSGTVVPRLDRFFSKLICWGEPCFNMANEPDFVVPYAYEYTNAPWKTDEVVTRIEQETFGTKADGIPGNDDLGATSGVYVWNALGLYPGVPGVGGMLVGTPMFPEATIRFGMGRTVRMERKGEGVYVTGLTVNGAPYDKLWLPLAEIPEEATTTLGYTVQKAEPRATRMEAPPDFMAGDDAGR